MRWTGASLPAIRLLVVSCLASVTGAAQGQEREPPAPRDPSLDPSAPLDQETRPAPWTLAVRLQESWEEEPRFAETGSTESASSYVDVAGLLLRYTSRGPRGRLAASVDGSFRRYHEQSGFNDAFYGGALSGSYRLTSRTDVSFQESIVSSYPRQSTFLLESGLVLPYVRTLTNSATADLTQRLSSTTSIAVEVRQEGVWFDSPALVDGTSLTLTPALRKDLGPRSSVSLSYSLERTMNTVTEDSTFHSLYATWRRGLGRAWTLSLAAGATRLPQTAVLDSGLTPYGAAELAWRGRHGFMTGSYTRAVEQAWGLGVPRTADIGALSVDVSPRRLGVFANGVYSLSRDLQGDVFRFTSVSATGGLRFKITRQLGLQGSYSLWRTRPLEGGGVPLRSQSVGLSANYEVEWR